MVNLKALKVTAIRAIRLQLERLGRLSTGCCTLPVSGLSSTFRAGRETLPEESNCNSEDKNSWLGSFLCSKPLHADALQNQCLNVFLLSLDKHFSLYVCAALVKIPLLLLVVMAELWVWWARKSKRNEAVIWLKYSSISNLFATPSRAQVNAISECIDAPTKLNRGIKRFGSLQELVKVIKCTHTQRAWLLYLHSLLMYMFCLLPLFTESQPITEWFRLVTHAILVLNIFKPSSKTFYEPCTPLASVLIC